MLYEKVTTVVKEALLLHQEANFYIPLNDFVKYITFNLIAYGKMRNKSTGDVLSMSQFLQKDKSYAETYAKSVKDSEDEFKMFHNTLRNAVNRYNSLNHKNEFNSLRRKEEEAKKKSRSSRFESHIEIYDFQIKGEMPILMKVKEKKDVFNTVYQRILKNNIHNINFTNYKLFSEYLNEEIEQQELTQDEKNLHHYLIEKHLKLHAIKKICRNYEILQKSTNPKLSEEELRARLELMIFATHSPMVQQWCSYIDLVLELKVEKFKKFIIEILSISNFIHWIYILYFNETDSIVCDEDDLTHFREYVDSTKFSNDYLLRKDFYSNTFATVMKEIKKANDNIQNERS